ncbi:MAG: PilC/PilY family type IV pilus protein [Desulfosoma sp.]
MVGTNPAMRRVARVVLPGILIGVVSAAFGAVCEPQRTVRYDGAWQKSHFSVLDPPVVIDPDTGRLVLRPGVPAPDWERIVTAKDQDVRVTFVFQGSEGSRNHLGYFLKSAAHRKGYIGQDGSLDRTAFVRGINFTDPAGYDAETFHYIFTCLRDENQNGILEKPSGPGCAASFPEAASAVLDYADTEEALARVEDGTGLAFVPDGDGRITVRDMTKSLGIIAEGEEIVFFMVPDGRFQDAFVTKASWNGDVYAGIDPCGAEFSDGMPPKTYRLNTSAPDDGTCAVDSGWLPARALERLREGLGIVFDPEDAAHVSVHTGKKFSHVIIGASRRFPTRWVMGWEDGEGGTDTDHNDLVVAVSLKAAGRAVSQDLTGAQLAETGAFITAVDVEVTDRRAPCEAAEAGFVLESGGLTGAAVSYFISVDNGTSWLPVRSWNEVIQGEDGFQTRKAHVDVLSTGRTGRALKWKAVLETVDGRCDPPEIAGVKVAYTAAASGEFSRADPVVLGNVLYSGSLETPSASWAEPSRLRGHLRAYKIYDPADPARPLFDLLWDAGPKLAERSFKTEPRAVLSPIGEARTFRETVGTGDGVTRRFQGNLFQGSVLPASVIFRSISEAGASLIVTESGEGDFQGDGAGTIHRGTGYYALEFVQAPCDGCPVKVEGVTFTQGSELRPFSEETLSALMLGLSDAYVHGTGYAWDLNGDGRYDDTDRGHLIRWVLGFDGPAQRPWPLDGIDHGTPAVVGPPGLPPWYFGTGTTPEERDAYDLWRQSESVAKRPTVAYTGSLGGMIHAFRAGRYRHGDDPRTPVRENRGYFDGHDYGDGAELWAFLPSNHISRLKLFLRPDPRAAPPSMDASPAVHDIAVATDKGPVFKTVLLSAQGAGGDTIVALDVTDPEKPSFLWEYADPDLYRSRAACAVAKIGRLNDRGSPAWAAFFPSGRTHDQSHPFLFVFDAARGSLIGKKAFDVVDTNRGALLSGSAAVVDSDGNGFADRAYLADNKGHVYRVDFPDRAEWAWDPAKIAVSLLVKVSSPVYATPVVYLAHRYKPDGTIDEEHVKVMFGTGDDPYHADSPNAPTGYKFYVFDDTCRRDGSGGVLRRNDGTPCAPEKMFTEAEAQWIWTLLGGHRIWAEAVAAAGRVYFGTAVTDTTDPCAPLQDEGKKGGTVYSVDLAALEPELEPTVVMEAEGNVTGLFVEDEHLYAKVTSREGGTRVRVVGDGLFNNETVLGTTYVTRKVKGSWRRILEK